MTRLFRILLFLTCSISLFVAVFGDCPPPPKVKDGDYLPKRTTYKTKKFVRYSCSPGFTLYGKKRIKCRGNGQWLATPVCVVSMCGPPPSIPLGTFSPIQDSYSPMDSVTYECCNGITINGASTNVCGNDGTWSLTGASLPSCTPTVCPPPPAVIEGIITSSDQKLTYLLGEIITYECNFGPKPGQVESNTCGADGLWTNLFPDICNEM